MGNKLENGERRWGKRKRESRSLLAPTFSRLAGRILWRSLHIDPGIRSGYFRLRRWWVIYETFTDNSVVEGMVGGGQRQQKQACAAASTFPGVCVGVNCAKSICTGSFPLDVEVSYVFRGKWHGCQVLERSNPLVVRRTRRRPRSCLFSNVTYSHSWALSRWQMYRAEMTLRRIFNCEGQPARRNTCIITDYRIFPSLPQLITAAGLRILTDFSMATPESPSLTKP